MNSAQLGVSDNFSETLNDFLDKKNDLSSGSESVGISDPFVELDGTSYAGIGIDAVDTAGASAAAEPIGMAFDYGEFSDSPAEGTAGLSE